MLAEAAFPLLAVDAVALDTETTGLDPAKARILQIGAVRLHDGAPDLSAGFDALVDPGEPIPPATTAIHGIDAAQVAGKPRFSQVFAEFEAFRAGRLVIGHNLGFDMAVIKRECGLAGLPFRRPPFLDTRLLGEIAFPGLAGYTLDILAARLGVDVAPETRHHARGDAITAARLFLALTPHLNERGVRTLGEADEACRRLTTSLEGFSRAGWMEPRARAEAAEAQPLTRIDAYPFRHRVRDVMGAPPVVVGPDMTLTDAIALMTTRKISSLFVGRGEAPPAAEVAIVTERDVLRAIAAHGAEALAMPVEALASAPLAIVPADAFLYRALGRMDRLKLRHLGVVDEDGRLAGALSARDLLKVRASDALMLGDAVEAAGSVPALASAFARMPDVARRLVEEGAPGLAVAAVISREIGAITRRAAREAEALTIAGGAGPAPAPYSVLVLGSVGRGESLLAADQDNAVVWADIDDPGRAAAADAWFAAFGEHLAQILDRVGVPLCKGGVMAKNPAFRGSYATWIQRIEGWLTRNRPEDLLAVDIFFDFRGVTGDGALARRLFEAAYDAAARAPMLSKLLAEQIGDFRAPLTLFGGLKAEEGGRIDLKKGGLFPVVAAARCLSMRHGVTARATPDRYEALRALKIGADADLEAFARAQGLIVDLILKQQIADIANGRPPGSKVDPATLTRTETTRLKAALGGLAHIGATVKDLLFRG